MNTDDSINGDRVNKLRAMLGKVPNDSFLLYALAMEEKKAGKHSESVRLLLRVIEVDAGYIAAYHQAGQVHAMAGDVQSARRMYQAGIDAAMRKGEMHAADEMRGEMEML